MLGIFTSTMFFFNRPIDHQLTSNDRLKPVMTTGLVNMHIDQSIANLVFIAVFRKFPAFSCQKVEFGLSSYRLIKDFRILHSASCSCQLLVGWFCCFTSQVNSYGHCGTVSSPNHTFSWAGLNKRLTSNLCTYFRL